MENINIIEIKEKLESKMFTKSMKRKTRSEVWDCFSLINDENNVIVLNVAVCNVCNQVLKCINWSSTKRHKCYISTLPSVNNEIKVNTVGKKFFFDFCSGTLSEGRKAILHSSRYGQFQILCT